MEQTKQKGLSIARRVLLVNSLLILFFIFSTVENVVKLNDSEEVITYSSEVLTPSVEAINHLILLVTRSKMYITNWLNQPHNNQDKTRLRELHNSQEHGYPKVIQDLSVLKKRWQNKEHILEIDQIIEQFSNIIQHEERIMSSLQTPKDYQDASKINELGILIHDEIIPVSYSLTERLQKLADTKVDEKQRTGRQVSESLNSLRQTIIILALLIVLFGFLITYLSSRAIGRPIAYLSKLMLGLSKGIIPTEKEIHFTTRQDEIGTIARAMERLVAGFKETTHFAKEIGEARYEADFEPLSNEDQLGNALISMRKSLQEVANKDQKRNWATQGITYLNDLLRRPYQNLEEFGHAIVLYLVKYMDANQGAAFLINENGKKEGAYMELLACYAWGKKKFLDTKIQKGEGLLGQAWQEASSIYMDDVPNDYAKITSGLGDANPKSILIIPLEDNQRVYGMLEFAFFSTLESYQIDFAEKAARNFASAISAVQNNEQRQLLIKNNQALDKKLDTLAERFDKQKNILADLQLLAEQESHIATLQLRALDKIVGRIVLDPTGKILDVNDRYLRMSAYTHLKDLKGKNHKVLLKKGYEISKTYLNLWEHLEKGDTIEKTFERTNKYRKSFWMYGVYYPILDAKGILSQVVGLFYDLEEYQQVVKQMSEKTLI